MLIQESFKKTKGFFQKTLRCIKPFLPGECPMLPPIFSTGNKISSKFQQLQIFCKSFSGRRHPSEVKKEGQTASKEQKGEDEDSRQKSMCVPDHNKLKGVKEGKKAHKYLGKQDKSSCLSELKLAQKMKELEMVDVNDGDHVLDVEEVLHYYSLLTSPVYLEIVDKFFMDMYYEFHVPQPTKSCSTSMRKLGCGGSVHGSIRKLGCGGSVHGSMRKLGCGSVHNSTRNIDLPGSRRKVGSGSMRKVDSPSIFHASMRKGNSVSVHSSMRKICPASAHSSMRSLGPLKL